MRVRKSKKNELAIIKVRDDFTNSTEAKIGCIGGGVKYQLYALNGGYKAYNWVSLQTVKPNGYSLIDLLCQLQ